MIEENEKIKKESDEFSWFINEYLNLNILITDKYFNIMSLLTIYFIYLKVNDNFLAKWYVTFYPLYLYLIPKILYSFYLIIQSDINNKKSNNNNKLKLNNLSNIYILSNLFIFLSNIILLTIIYNIHNFLDNRNDIYLIMSLKFLLIYFILLIIYSFLTKLKIFSLNFNNNYNNLNNSTFFAFISPIITPLLTYLSNMMIICSGGACSQIYVSTITSLLGAFGITITEISEYMFPITIILLGISLFSLYIKKKKLTHPPFLLGLFSSIIIIIGKYYENSIFKYGVYLGNIFMIVAAIWNAKLNKFTGLPVYNKINN